MKDWMWVLIICIGFGLFAMMFGFFTTSLLLFAAFIFVAWKTWDIVYNNK
jgi:hypothetical protein